MSFCSAANHPPSLLMVLEGEMTLRLNIQLPLFWPFLEETPCKGSLVWNEPVVSMLSKNLIATKLEKERFKEISESRDVSYNNSNKQEKIVYLKNTRYIFMLNWWFGITIEQGLVVSRPVCVCGFFNFKSACQCFSIQCTQCELQHLKCLAGHSCSWHHMLGGQGGHCRAGPGERQHQWCHWDVPTKECVTARCAA